MQVINTKRTSSMLINSVFNINNIEVLFMLSPLKEVLVYHPLTRQIHIYIYIYIYMCVCVCVCLCVCVCVRERERGHTHTDPEFYILDPRPARLQQYQRYKLIYKMICFS